MHRLLAPLLATTLTLACGEAPPATPAKAPVTKPTVAPPPPAQVTPPAPAPGADDPRCGAAAVYLNAVRSATGQPTPQIATIRTAYVGTALQLLIKASDSATSRTDDPTITALLAASEPTAPIAAEYAIHGALAQWMRHNLKVAVEDPDRARRGEAWAAARCVWSQDLRHLGLALQTRAAAQTDPGARDDAGAAEAIDAAFTVGSVALAAEPIDERVLLPARQTIEKTWYRVVHRELGDAATHARADNDATAARRALGLFDMLRDRLQDKNTPGIALITAQLTAAPDTIDPAAILRQIDIALAKRARKYCSEALDPKLLATAPGIASAQEGAIYTRVILPGMRQALADQKFDPDAHMANWVAFVEAVEVGVDQDELKRLSDDLTHWNCAYQQALGIRECTATVDEIAAKR